MSAQIENNPSIEDLNYITSGILVKSVSKDASEAIRNEIVSYVHNSLKNEKLTRDDIEQIKIALENYYEDSLVVPGESVGVLAATSLGELSTQTALNAHRTAGVSSKSTNEGIPRLEELLRVSESQKNVSMSIFFNKRLNLDELKKVIPMFVCRYLEYFISSTDVESRDNLGEEEWQNRYRLINDFREDTPEYILRLYINVEKMLKYNLNLERITNILRNHFGEDINFIHSSNFKGIIDVYFYPQKSKTENPLDSAVDVIGFIKNVILKKLSDIQITGVENITDVFPTKLEISSLISSWKGNKIQIKADKAEKFGIKLDDFRELLAEAKYSIVSYDEQTSTITLDKSDGDIARIVDDAKNNPRLKDLNNHWYIETNGSNLPVVLGMDIVNDELTFSSNPVEIYKTFGIGAARDYLLEEFIRVVASNGWVDPRHVMLLTDVMTNLGKLSSVSAMGSKFFDTGILQKLADERPIENAIDESVFGEGDPIKSASSAIFTGSYATIGPNAFVVRNKDSVSTDMKDMNVSTHDNIDTSTNKFEVKNNFNSLYMSGSKMRKGSKLPERRVVVEEKKEVTKPTKEIKFTGELVEEEDNNEINKPLNKPIRRPFAEKEKSTLPARKILKPSMIQEKKDSGLELVEEEEEVKPSTRPPSKTLLPQRRVLGAPTTTEEKEDIEIQEVTPVTTLPKKVEQRRILKPSIPKPSGITLVEEDESESPAPQKKDDMEIEDISEQPKTILPKKIVQRRELKPSKP